MGSTCMPRSTLLLLPVQRPSVAGRGLVAVAGAAAAAALLWYAVKGRTSGIFGRSVYRGHRSRLGAGRGTRSEKSIALTFDDGPSERTAALLAYLAERNVRATFFQCGLNAERLPALARAVSAAGHEIGNHTYAHPRLAPRLSRSPNLLSPGQVDREISRAQEILTRLHGRPPRLFRAPYGMRWFGVGRAQRRLGLLGVLWTVIGHDWEWPAEQIADHVLRGTAPGGILCLHDGRDIQPDVDLTPMLQALRLIIPPLQEAGYHFATVSELLSPEPA